MEAYLIYLLVVITILLIVQAAVFVGFYILARRAMQLAEQVGQLQTRAEYLISNTEPVVKMAHTLMGELKEASDYFSQGAQHISAIAEMAKDQAADIQDLMGDTTALARREIERTRQHVDKVQRTLSDATDQFERTTAMVQASVLQPAREFSYLMYGVRRAVEVLMAGNRLPVNRAYQDEEMFI
ncbi:MAG: hypothetical protein KF868_02835 [Acidobacteria bacterium]|nr:hypothetical protein [Acidobacteriota bacterium]MCW5969981.1 hypothetical protein [Blastocatellales bacterium]